MKTQYRVGDVLTISCPFTPAQVSSVGQFHVFVKWPWHQPDPETPQYRWNGDHAVTSNPTFSSDWDRELFRTDPAPKHLKAGDDCLVGIPLTVVHIIDIAEFDPPQANGILPRPETLLVVLPAGQSQVPDFDDQGDSINPDDDIPIDIDLLFRPYSFLEPGDDIVDHDGRAWRFDGPWHWHPYDNHSEPTPTWPLKLLTRHGEDAPEAAAEVAAATTTGSHARLITQWKRLANATPLNSP